MTSDLRIRVLLVASLCACDCSGVTRPLANRDAGVRDGGTAVERDAGSHDGGPIDTGVADAGVVDAGVVDAGVRDGGPRDGGEVPDAGPPDAGCPGTRPTIEPMPWDILVLTRAAPRSDVIVTNSGDGTLTISTLDITGPNATSFDDFSVTGCAAMPCTVTTSLCGGDTTNFEVVYANNDISTQDAVELRIRSNDATNPEHILVIHGVDSPCLFPNPVITVVTQQPRVGAVVEVNGLLSNPGGQSGVTNTIVRWDWQWLFAPTPSPAFTGQNTPTVQFTPTQSGSYFIGLNVTNDCGAMSQGSAAEMINVSNN